MRDVQQPRSHTYSMQAMVLFFILAVPSLILGLWLGDTRWLLTGVVFGGAAVASGFLALVTWRSEY